MRNHLEDHHSRINFELKSPDEQAAAANVPDGKKAMSASDIAALKDAQARQQTGAHFF